MLGRGVLPVYGLRGETGLERLAQEMATLAVPLRFCGPTGHGRRTRSTAQPETQRQAALESAGNGYVALVLEASESAWPAVVKEEPRSSWPRFETQALRTQGCKRRTPQKQERWASKPACGVQARVQARGTPASRKVGPLHSRKKRNRRATFPPDTG